MTKIPEIKRGQHKIVARAHFGHPWYRGSKIFFLIRRIIFCETQNKLKGESANNRFESQLGESKMSYVHA